MARRLGGLEESGRGPLTARVLIKAGTKGRLTFYADNMLYIAGDDDSPSHVAVIWEVTADPYGAPVARASAGRRFTRTCAAGLASA